MLRKPWDEMVSRDYMKYRRYLLGICGTLRSRERRAPEPGISGVLVGGVHAVEVREHCLRGDFAEVQLRGPLEELLREIPAVSRKDSMLSFKEPGIEIAVFMVGLRLYLQYNQIVPRGKPGRSEPLQSRERRSRDRGARGDRRVLPIVASRRYDLSAVISHRLPLHDGVRGYDIFARGLDGCTKVVLSRS